ncbi:transposase [Citrobacter koseri]
MIESSCYRKRTLSMSVSPHLSKNRASYTMEFKLGLVEKSYRPGACVAHLAREHGIKDNLLFTWRQRYRHLLPDDVQRNSKRTVRDVG